MFRRGTQRLAVLQPPMFNRTELVRFGLKAGGCKTAKRSSLFETLFVDFPLYYSSCYLALPEAYLIFIRKLWELVKMACLPISYFVCLWPTVGTLWGGRGRNFLETSGRYWVASYKSFDSNRLLVGRGRKQSNFAGFSGPNSRKKTADFAGISREFPRPFSPKNDR